MTPLIVGASRGLGLGLAHQYLNRGRQLSAPSKDQRGPSRTILRMRLAEGEVETVDVVDSTQVTDLRQPLVGRSFDLLFVNAGRCRLIEPCAKGLSRNNRIGG